MSSTIEEQPLQLASPESPGSRSSAPAATAQHAARPHKSSLRQQLVAGDVLALLSTWGTLVALKWGRGDPKLAACAGAALVVTLAAMRYEGLYRARICALRSLEAVRVTVSCLVGTSTFLVLQLVGMKPDPGEALAAGGASVATVLLMRWRYGRWLKARRSASRNLRTVLLVGANEDTAQLWTILSEEPSLGYRVGGVVGLPFAGAPWNGIPKRAGVAAITELAAETGANGVIVIASALGPHERRAAVASSLAAGLHVQVWPGSYGMSSRRAPAIYRAPQGSAVAVSPEACHGLVAGGDRRVADDARHGRGGSGGQVFRAGPSHLPEQARRQARRADRRPQVPHHGARRRQPPSRSGKAQRKAWAPLQSDLRPPRDQGRQVAPRHQRGRTTPALERHQRDDEHGGPPPCAPPQGGDLRR